MVDELETIGDYRVLRPIGKGGMAEVFAVERTGPAGFEKQLCLKRIRRDLAQDRSFVESFETEARLVAKLEHPNIVQVFDFFRHEGDLCLVMELVDGMDLNALVRAMYTNGSQFPVTAAVYILESLLRALEYAHHLNVKGKQYCVIHRDISPHNLLISNIGTVKLVDFGVAKAKGMTPDTPEGSLKGKLSYLAPERLKLGKVPVGPQSDLFSAGIVFWEMLATKRLFKATMEHQVLAKVMHFEKAPIDYLCAGMNQFLEKLLAPDPEDRFRSADEALLALRDVGVPPCTQGEIARLVRETRGYKEYKDWQLEMEAEQEAEEADPIPLIKSTGSGVLSSASESDEITGIGRGGFLRFGHAVAIGVALVVLVVGIWGAWTYWGQDSSDVVTVKESVKAEAPEEPRISSKNMGKDAKVGIVVLNAKVDAVENSISQEDSETIAEPSADTASKSAKQRQSKKHRIRKKSGNDVRRAGDKPEDFVPLWNE